MVSNVKSRRIALGDTRTEPLHPLRRISDSGPSQFKSSTDGALETIKDNCLKIGLGENSLRYVSRIMTRMARSYEDGVTHYGESHIEHTANVLRAAEALAAQAGLGPQQMKILRTAALFHDIGKVFIREDGTPVRHEKETPAGVKASFFAHGEEGGKRIEKILGRLNRTEGREVFTQDEIASVRKLVDEHMLPLSLIAQEPSEKALRNFISRTAGLNDALFGDYAAILILLAKADTGVAKSPSFNPESESVKKLERLERAVFSEREKISAGEKAKAEQKQHVTSEELIQLGIPPGPDFGKILRAANKASDREEALSIVVAMVAELD